MGRKNLAEGLPDFSCTFYLEGVLPVKKLIPFLFLAACSSEPIPPSSPKKPLPEPTTMLEASPCIKYTPPVTSEPAWLPRSGVMLMAVEFTIRNTCDRPVSSFLRMAVRGGPDRFMGGHDMESGTLMPRETKLIRAAVRVLPIRVNQSDIEVTVQAHDMHLSPVMVEYTR